MARFLLLNGPNLNLIGQREPAVYGTRTFDDLLQELRAAWPQHTFTLQQSNVEGTLIDLPDCGAVLRCNPDGSERELVHTGLRNPQELAFDDFGNLFTGDNDCDQGDIERWVHVVEGADSGWRVGYQHHPLGKAGPWNLEHLWLPRFDGQPAYILPPIANTPDGPSGLTYYPGTGLPESYRGSFFMCHFRGSFTNSAIYRYQLAAEGASFRLTLQENFLSGTLPTDVDFGPDGRLYFSDWGQGWAKSSP